MRTAIVIPARLTASRLPGKPLAVLGGLPLVVRVAQQACKCPGIALVAIATDSHDIYEAARDHGIRAVMTRPDHTSGTDRVAQAVGILEAESPIDAVINLQGDEPFIDPHDLDTVARALETAANDMVTLRTPITSSDDLENPNVVKVVCRDDDTALYFSRAPIPFDRTGSGSVQHARRHVGVYGYQRAALATLCATPAHPLEEVERLEQLRALALGMRILVKTVRTAGRGIDTPTDLEWARKRVAQLGEAAFPNY